MPKTAISFLIGVACWLTAASPLAAAELKAQQKIVLTSAASLGECASGNEIICADWRRSRRAGRIMGALGDLRFAGRYERTPRGRRKNGGFAQRRQTRRERFSQARLQRPLPASRVRAPLLLQNLRTRRADQSQTTGD